CERMYAHPEIKSDSAIIPVAGKIIQDCSSDLLATAVSVAATKIIPSGQIAYVDPQSCWDMNAPLIAAIKMKGSVPARFARRLIVAIEMMKLAIKITGHIPSRRSARSDASVLRNK